MTALLVMVLILAGCSYSYMRPKEESSLESVQQLGQTIAAGQVAQAATASAMPSPTPKMMPATPNVAETIGALATPTLTLSPTPTFSWLAGPAATVFISATLTPASIRTAQPTAPYQVTVEPPATIQNDPIAAPTWTVAPSVPYVPGGSAATATPTASNSTAATATATAVVTQAVVTDWTWELVDGQVQVSGAVANEASQAMAYVRINILLLNADGGFLATAGTYADAVVIQPGEESTWSLQVDAPESFATAELSQVITWEWYD